ncbi:MAG TPA: phospholipase D-like domain-containing protein [Myxococcota bacterium]|nr:phospholipase D-like domain-containing protein [Myxococcota bacterium]
MRRALALSLFLAAPSGAGTPPDRRPTAAAPVRLILRDPTPAACPMTDCATDFCQSLLELIDHAQTSIDFAIYGMRGQPVILDALQRAQARGVAIRGVVDRTVDGKNYYSDTETMIEVLQNIRDDLATDQLTAKTRKPYDPSKSFCWMNPPPEFKGPKQCVGYDLGDRCIVAVHASTDELSFQGDIMHDKFFVVDRTYVWMGSTNVSDSCSGGYNGNLVGVLDSPTVAAWYATEFEQMWEGKFHAQKASQGPMHVQLTPDISAEAYFSPQDDPMVKAVRPLLQGARSRIDVAIFFLTHKGIAADLIAAHRRGVQVRVVLDATAAGNGYTKHELLRAAGIPVKVESWGGKMHMKAAAIDGEHVIMGSMNWTSAGENGNDENTIVLHSRAHAKQFEGYFEQIWKEIPDRWLQGRPDPESKDSGAACTDGVDNDYDHNADAKDPGCGDHPPPLAPLPEYRIVPKADGQGLLKGNVTESGAKTYHVPGGEWYDKVQIEPSQGDMWFCSEEDARKAGFKRASQ